MTELEGLTGSGTTLKRLEEAILEDLPKLRECAFIDIFASSPLLKVQNASILKVKIDEQRMKSENSTAVIASSGDLESAYSRVCVLVVDSRCCNDSELKAIDFSRFSNLIELRVGDDSFENVEEVKVVGLAELKKVVIGENSFTKRKSNEYFPENPDRHFYLRNCERLTELKIGCFSFCDYSVCEIDNLLSLEVIDIGALNGMSCNFYHASLKLKSVSQRRRMMNRLT